MKTTLEKLTTFKVEPLVTIPEGVALSESSTGYARALVLGERFCGFASETLLRSRGETSVQVQCAGTIELIVDRLSEVVPGVPVFATGSRTFSTSAEVGATEIGTISKITGNRRALVEFSA